VSEPLINLIFLISLISLFIFKLLARHYKSMMILTLGFRLEKLL